MTSWKLFVHVLLAQNSYDNAIFMREVEQIPVWHDWLQRLGRTAGLKTGLLLGSAILWTISVLYVNNLLFVLIPLLLSFTLATGLSLGPLVPAEREKQRWEILLSVPAGAEMILMGKMGGALWRMRHFMFIMTMLLIMVALGVGAISSLVLLPIERAKAGWSELTLCGVMFLLMLLGSAVFIVDRVQQYLLIITAGIAGGTSATNSRTALLAAGGAALFAWFFEIGATGTIMLLQHKEAILLERGQILSWATLGPMVSYILRLDRGWAVVYIVVTLLVRELLIGSLWRWTLHHARP